MGCQRSGWLNQSAGSQPSRYWDIEREASIHLHPEQRISLLFNRRSAASSHAVIAVGVRVQSLLVTPGRFAQGVDAELTRLEAEALRVPFNVCHRFVLALTSDAEGAAAMRARGFETLATGAKEMAMLMRGVGG